VAKTEGGATERYLYDGVRPVLHTDGNWATLYRYLYTGSSYYDMLISARQNATTVYRFRYDATGSTRLITYGIEQFGYEMGAGQLMYKAFGEIFYQIPTTPTVPYKYIGSLGYYKHETTPLLHVGARYYSPQVGRFWTQDPEGEGVNWYAYVSNAPVNAFDPEGLQTPPSTGAGIMVRCCKVMARIADHRHATVACCAARRDRRGSFTAEVSRGRQCQAILCHYFAATFPVRSLRGGMCHHDNKGWWCSRCDDPGVGRYVWEDPGSPPVPRRRH
jgi:RHS repeat-associated protein